MENFIFQSHDTLPMKIGEQIKKLIERGGCRRGDPLPSYRELCSRFKVSLLTVKRAMDELAREGIVHIQHGKGVYVGKELSPQTRKLSQIGVVFFCSRKLMFTSQYLIEIFQGVLQESEAISADARLFSVKNQGPMPPEEVETSGVDGVILVGVANERYLRNFACQHMSVIAVDVTSADIPLEFVSVDNDAAVKQVMEHLTALGHRRIEYVGGWSTDTAARSEPTIETSDVIERRDAYVRTMRKLGLGDGVVHAVNPNEPNATGALVAESIARSKSRPTALLAYDSTVARSIIERFTSLGMKVPRDISVAAAAGASDALCGSLTLTYNRVRFVEMGAKAVQALAARCRQPRVLGPVSIRIGSDFVAGNTAAALSDSVII